MSMRTHHGQPRAPVPKCKVTKTLFIPVWWYVIDPRIKFAQHLQHVLHPLAARLSYKDAFLPSSSDAHGAPLLLLNGGDIPAYDRVVQSRDEEAVILIACCMFPGFYVRVIFNDLPGWLYWPREGD